VSKPNNAGTAAKSERRFNNPGITASPLIFPFLICGVVLFESQKNQKVSQIVAYLLFSTAS
jgi:hypothetical protein